MSWSINSSGRQSAVAVQVLEQASHIKLDDPGEMETATNAVVLITQTLGTFDADALVKVEASGSMSFRDWSAKTGKRQQISVKVEPIYLTT